MSGSAWNIRTKPEIVIASILFNDQFYTFNDINAPFNGVIGGYDNSWSVRVKPT